MKDYCSCGEKFRDAEDFRDHLPCDGSEVEQLKAEINKLKGLLHSELLSNANYCESCELAYTSPIETSNKCPRCEWNRLENEKSDSKSITLTLKEAELIRNKFMGDIWSGNKETVNTVFSKIDNFVIGEWDKEEEKDAE